MVISNYNEYLERLDALESETLKDVCDKDIERDLNALIDNLNNNKDKIASMTTKDTGKPIKYSIWEIERSIDLIRSFISYLHFPNIESGRVGVKAFGAWRKIYKPIGVVIGFTPFSSPISSFLHKMIASLIYRNKFFCKPSPRAKNCSLELYEIIIRSLNSKLKNFVSIILIDDTKIGELLENGLYDCILFTGKTKTASIIKESIGRKRGVFETGSMAMTYVAKSADIKTAAKEIVNSSFSQSGMRCIATKNAFIHEHIYDEFLKALEDEMSKIKVGDCFDKDVDVSYILFEELKNELALTIEKLRNNGYKVISGGEFTTDNILLPTILENSGDSYKSLQELYGPVLCIFSTTGYDEIPVEYKMRSSINSAIFSNDLSEINRWEQNNDYSGSLYVNHNTATRFDHLPFGGFNDENEGKEGIAELSRVLAKEQLYMLL